MAFRIENIIFSLLYDHPLVAKKGGYFDNLVVAELYIVQSVSFLQTFQVVIITADIAIGKSGIHCSTMYRLRNLPMRIERFFGWSPALLLFGQIWFYQFGQDVFVYAESERFKVRSRMCTASTTLMALSSLSTSTCSMVSALLLSSVPM